MARTIAAIVLVAAAVCSEGALLVSRAELRGAAQSNSSSTFTINDKVYVDGGMFAESAALNDNVGCHEHKGTSTFKVCGCGVKVVAHMLTECQTYEHYDETIGACDCSNPACVEKTLTSGYTAEFNWKAASFEIAACR